MNSANLSMETAEARKVTYKETEDGVIPVYADQLVLQPSSYSEEDNQTWRTLLARQKELVVGRAHPIFIESLEKMGFGDTIPQFSDINEKLNGWEIVAVNGLISHVAFFDLLAHKKFPVTWWMRTPAQIDYIQEPDLFHDLFGHVPLLERSDYSDLMQTFGKLGIGERSNDAKFMTGLGRLYWYSIEFGLMKHQGKLSVFGAGILSSPGELSYALDPKTPHKPFVHSKVANTAYRIDTYQPSYFTSDSFEKMREEILAYAKS